MPDTFTEERPASSSTNVVLGLVVLITSLIGVFWVGTRVLRPFDLPNGVDDILINIGVLAGYVLGAFAAFKMSRGVTRLQSWIMGRRLHVGDDGISIEKRLRRPTFISWREIFHVSGHGESVRIETTEPFKMVTLEPAMTSLHNYRKAYQSLPQADLDARLLPSRGWVKRLKDLSRFVGDYRSASISNAELTEIATTANADPRARCAAAFVLKQRDPEIDLAALFEQSINPLFARFVASPERTLARIEWDHRKQALQSPSVRIETTVEVDETTEIEPESRIAKSR